jgi:hypothetical protein
MPSGLREIEGAAPSLGMQVSEQAVHNTAEIERVLDAHPSVLNGGPSVLNGGLIVLSSPVVDANRKQIIDHCCPAINRIESIGYGLAGQDSVGLHH